MSDDDDVVSVGRYEWDRIVRRCVLPPTVDHVACKLSQYANADGTRVYPGVARLVAVTGLSERSVRGALTQLRALALITRTRKGSSLGRQAMTDEHRLTRPADLASRVHMLDPDETPESAVCTDACTHPRSPARGAAVRPVDNPAATQEHRQLVPGTPARGAGTPAAGAGNTGSTCTPPPEDLPSTTRLDQRDDQDSYATTDRARVVPLTRRKAHR